MGVAREVYEYLSGWPPKNPLLLLFPPDDLVMTSFADEFLWISAENKNLNENKIK